MEQSAGASADHYELSGADQLVRVTAYCVSHGLKYNSTGAMVLGELSAEETGSVSAEINLIPDTENYYSYGIVCIPEDVFNLPPVSLFAAVARQLKDEGEVDIVAADACSTIKTSMVDTFNIIKLVERAPDEGGSFIYIAAKDNDHDDYESLEPDALNYDKFDVDAVVMDVSRIAGEIINALHGFSESDLIAPLNVALPGAMIRPGKPGELAIIEKQPDILPEHADFPSFEQLGGLNDEIQRLREIIADRQNSEQLREFGLDIPNGVILQGPGGVGKTALIQALAKETRSTLQVLSVSDIQEGLVGKAEENLRKLFDSARESDKDLIVFFDEFDGLFSKYAGGNAGSAQSLISELKMQLEKIRKSPNVLVVAAANSLANFDPALLRSGRFDIVIQIQRPSTEKLAEIFGKYLEARADHFNLPNLHSGPDPRLVDPFRLATLAEDFTGSDVKTVINAVMRDRLRALRAGGKQPAKTTQQEIEAAITYHRHHRPNEI